MCERITGSGTQITPILVYKVMLGDKNPFCSCETLSGKWVKGIGQQVCATPLSLPPQPGQGRTLVAQTEGGFHVFHTSEEAHQFLLSCTIFFPIGLRVVEAIVWGDYHTFEGGGAYEFCTLGGGIDEPSEAVSR